MARPIAIPIVLAVLVGSAGCGPSDWRETRIRVADLVAARNRLGRPPAATIGIRTHYVLNDVGPRRLEPAGGGEPVGHADRAGTLAIAATCPRAWRGRPVLLDVALIPTPAADTPVAPREEAAAIHHTAVVPCLPAGGVDTTVRGLDPGAGYHLWHLTGMVAPQPRTVTPWIDLPDGARLKTALGVRRAGPGTGTVTMTLSAENAGGIGVLLGRWHLPPDPARDSWKTVEVPLASARARLGTRVRLVFETTPSSTPTNITIPLWGSPTIYGDVSPAERTPPPNVVLVSLDTLRADRLGTHGFPLPVTPNLDRLAADGTLMERATATANWTLPSHASMLTGLHPCAHGFRGSLSADAPAGFPPMARPIAEILRAAGYETAAFTEDAYVDRVPFQRGFDLFDADHGIDDAATGGLAERTFAKATAWLATARERPVFLLVHTYQVHAPYAPSDAARARVPTPLPLPPGGVPPSDDLADDAARYVAEVAETDAAVGDFLAALDRLDLRASTIVVVTSDHGESFGEHGNRRHGFGLYEEELWVPLLWRAPGRIAAGRRVDGLTTLADVPPTLLALLGLPIPPWMQGVSLAPLLDPTGAGAPPPYRVLPLEGMVGRGFRGPGFKLLRFTVNGDRDRLLLAATDPQERASVAAPAEFVRAAQAVVRRDCARAKRLLGRRAPRRARDAVPLDAARRRKLEALGYVE